MSLLMKPRFLAAQVLVMWFNSGCLSLRKDESVGGVGYMSHANGNQLLVLPTKFVYQVTVFSLHTPHHLLDINPFPPFFSSARSM